ncbi:hypothetical protein [Kitasatospora sp. NBC_00315]|uniref:hypothetical protein n=1 Tax=Kitasatospora sp. NBC_00315 TaxID=2975963 RepID=UPI003246CAE7
MTASEPGHDGPAGPAAPHYSVPAWHDEAPAGYVAPGMPGAPTPYAYAPLIATAKREPNLGGAIAAALAAVVVGALAYGFVMKALEHEFSWLVIGLGAAIGWPLGRLGGRGAALPVIGAVLAVAALFLGQFFYATLVLHEVSGASVGDLLGTDRDVTFQLWQANRGVYDVLFYGIALMAGGLTTRRFGYER